jgi:hypothetical protein
MGIREIDIKGVDWIQLSQDKVHWETFFEHDDNTSGSIKRGIEQLAKKIPAFLERPYTTERVRTFTTYAQVSICYCSVFIYLLSFISVAKRREICSIKHLMSKKKKHISCFKHKFCTFTAYKFRSVMVSVRTQIRDAEWIDVFPRSTRIL